MTDPRQLASLDGQQYLLLRPTGSVIDAYAEAQTKVLEVMPEDAKHPNTAHVTLRGFFEPTRLTELRDALRGWAARTGPIRIAVEALTLFPAPFQIPIVRIARDEGLTRAYASLTESLTPTDYRRLDEMDLEDWIFHLSVAYGRQLDAEAWSRVEEALAGIDVGTPECIVEEAEFVWYDGGEHREILPLGG